MPFVTRPHRDAPDLTIAGDRTYREYKFIMDKWAESPRWTTIDKLAERLYPDEYERAYFLALLIFMAFHGYEYEQDKREENGDIEGAKND